MVDVDELVDVDEDEVLLEEFPTLAATSSNEQQDFMILGSEKQTKKKVVRRVLPDWLAHPELVSLDLSSGPILDDVKDTLDSKLIELLRTNGVIRLFPMQARVISWLLEREDDHKRGRWLRDACVSAPTGSGMYFNDVINNNNNSEYNDNKND